MQQFKETLIERAKQFTFPDGVTFKGVRVPNTEHPEDTLLVNVDVQETGRERIRRTGFFNPLWSELRNCLEKELPIHASAGTILDVSPRANNGATCCFFFHFHPISEE